MICHSSSAILLLIATLCAADSPSIPFSPLPTLPEPVSTSRDTSRGLGGFYRLAGGIVDTIRPGHLPRDTVGDLAATVSDNLGLYWGIPAPDTDTKGLVNEFLRWLASTIAAVVLGVLLAVVVPLAGCCTLCCRACGHCGAKSRIYRKKNQNVKCLVLTSIFLVTTSMILVGAIIGAVSVKHVSGSLGELESTADTALSDVASYMDSGAQQMFFVADDQFGVFEAHVLNDVDHIGEWFESSIGSGLQSDALSIIDQASLLLEELRAIDGLVVSGNTLIGDLKNTTQALIAQISTLATDMENLRNVCTALHGPGGVCDSLSSTNLAVTVSFTDIENIKFNEDVDFSTIKEEIGIAKDMFTNMAEFIDSEAEEYGLSQKVEEEFSSTHSTLEYDYLNALNETVHNIVSDGGHIDKARGEIHTALKYLVKYEAVWNGVGLLLVLLFLLIVIFFVVGLFCGVFGYSRHTQPHSRSSVSNCGGRCILMGILVGFVTSPVLLMTAAVSFGLATGAQKLCQDLQPPEYPILREVVDDPAVWGGLTLVGLVTREETYTAVNLSLYQSLSRCAENEALWKALDGDELYSYTDFDEAFNCTSLGVGSEDFLPYDGFSSEDIFPYLSDVNNSFNTIDFTEFEDKINETQFLSFDLAELEANLTLVINASANTTALQLASQILGDLDFINKSVQALHILQGHAEGNVTKLQNSIETSEQKLVMFIDDLQRFIPELQDVVSKATDEYVDRLCGFVEEYIKYANETIRNELGRCRVFPAAYGAVYSTVCGNALDGLNGYWLGVGWSMLFTLVGAVVGLVLSDYFRRTGTRIVRCNDTTSVSESVSLVPRDEDDDDNASLISMQPKGKSYPSNVRALPEEQQPLHTTEMDMEW